jgi:hypothetical protein
MTDQRQAWERPEENAERDVFLAELVGEPGPDGRNPVAREIGGWITRVIESIRAKIRRHRSLPPSFEESRASVVAGQATTTAVAALEGKLRSTSLDGVLKEAYILEAYANARLKNAQAEKQEAETEKLRQDMAFARLERVIALCESHGTPVKVIPQPGGRLAVSIGENLMSEFLELPAEPAAGEDVAGE